MRAQSSLFDSPSATRSMSKVQARLPQPAGGGARSPGANVAQVSVCLLRQPERSLDQRARAARTVDREQAGRLHFE